MHKKINWEKIKTPVAGFFKKVGKKNLVVALAILVLGGAVYVNYLLFSDPIDAIGYGTNNMEDTYTADLPQKIDIAEEPPQDTYFATTVLSRQKARDEALQVLQTVVESGEAMEATKAQAFADISQIAKDIENEANIETLIEAKGFSDCVAVVNGSTVNIVVRTEGLLASEVAQINEIVYEQAGVLPVNVKIVERSAS